MFRWSGAAASRDPTARRSGRTSLSGKAMLLAPREAPPRRSDVVTDATLDRSIGAFLGLAIGDALGAPVEGRSRDSYPCLRDYTPSVVHGLEAGEWTDDTAMALCLAQSLLACRPFDPG